MNWTWNISWVTISWTTSLDSSGYVSSTEEGSYGFDDHIDDWQTISAWTINAEMINQLIFGRGCPEDVVPKITSEKSFVINLFNEMQAASK
jgi:hypothetical protein